MKPLLSALALVLATVTAASAYDEFAPRGPGRGGVLQEQRSGPAPLRQYELIIKNRAYSPVTSVYAKSIRMNNFSVDLIPGVIQPGRQGLVELIDSGESCEWIVKAEFADSSTATKTLNVCSTNSLTLN